MDDWLDDNRHGRRTHGVRPGSGDRPDEATVQLKALSVEGRNADRPIEVTVQLKAVSIGDRGRDTGPPTRRRSETATSQDGPVFVDSSGRRSRRFRRLGALIGLVCAVYAVAIVVTLLSGNSSAPWLPVPEQKQRGGAPAEQPEPTPLSGEAAPSPSGTGPATDGVATDQVPEPSPTAPAADTSAGLAPATPTAPAG
ncbi:hypothetical protein [Streptomyces sp. UH6]|uniref:hypothetical protein n=1 Tax=Streptomyces sp. UH6 TaxID=2748379 RepID=UPI0015D4EE61|nr:hypothetical protein [Streptomyces sp. UH6]NYV75214.1 hypothetical protein [Streptomyces sp. UH6]